jgi:hypothetical protein
MVAAGAEGGYCRGTPEDKCDDNLFCLPQSDNSELWRCIKKCDGTGSPGHGADLPAKDAECARSCGGYNVSCPTKRYPMGDKSYNVDSEGKRVCDEGSASFTCGIIDHPAVPCFAPDYACEDDRVCVGLKGGSDPWCLKSCWEGDLSRKPVAAGDEPCMTNCYWTALDDDPGCDGRSPMKSSQQIYRDMNHNNLCNWSPFWLNNGRRDICLPKGQ